MSVEILSVSLSDESIERVALRVIELMSDKSGSVSPNTRRTQPAQASREEVDPWASDADPTSASTRPSRSGSGTTASSDSGTKTVKTKNGVQTWRFPSDAPECDCGQPAGLVSAASAEGKRYKAFRCAKRAGDDWRNACEFNDWA